MKRNKDKNKLKKMWIYKGMFCFCFSLSALFFPFPFVKTNEKSYDKRKKQRRKGKANAKFTFTFLCFYLFIYFKKRERERRWAGEWQVKGGKRTIDPFSSTLFSTLFTHTSALIARFIITSILMSLVGFETMLWQRPNLPYHRWQHVCINDVFLWDQ